MKVTQTSEKGVGAGKFNVEWISLGGATDNGDQDPHGNGRQPQDCRHV